MCTVAVTLVMLVVFHTGDGVQHLYTTPSIELWVTHRSEHPAMFVCLCLWERV